MNTSRYTHLKNLILTFIIFVHECADVQHKDGITYVRTTSIDNISCFNTSIENPCKSFTYNYIIHVMIYNYKCVIIILDCQSQVINSTYNVVFRQSQS